MVINDVVKVTDEIREQLSGIFNSQFDEVKDKVNYMLTYPDSTYAHEFDYHNIFQQGHNNIVRYHDESSMMSVFNFNMRNSVKIYRLLQIEKHKPMLNGIRVYAGNKVPMHIDANRGDIGRENPILSIVLSGTDGYVYMSNVRDGNHYVSIPGKVQFVMYPTLIEHGACAGLENYDVLQLQLTEMP